MYVGKGKSVYYICRGARQQLRRILATDIYIRIYIHTAKLFS